MRSRRTSRRRSNARHTVTREWMTIASRVALTVARTFIQRFGRLTILGVRHHGEPDDVPVRLSLRHLRTDLLGTQKRLVKDHGGFGRCRVLTHVFTLVASGDANQHMFVREPQNYRRGPQYDNLALAIGRGLICSEGADWQRQRKLAQPAFDKALMARVVEITKVLTTQLLADWDRAARSGECVEVLDDMQDLAMRVMGMALFSRDLRTDVGEDGDTASFFIEALQSGAAVVFRRNISPIPLPLWIPSRLNRRFRRARAAVDRFVYKLIDERLRGESQNDDILSELLRAYGDYAPQTRRELRDQVVTLFFAGFETTAVALAWTWLLLSQHPEAEARFHEELARVLGGRLPALHDLKSLTYTSQVIQESLRIYPPVYSLTREVAADDQICGHQVHSGDNIVIPIDALHHMPEYWEEPAAFCPERFAPGRLTEAQRNAYLPFSFGPRRCLGASFATIEMLTVLSVVGQRVRLQHDSESPVIATPAVTQRPVGGLRMRLEARS
jgi:cytochrome P450